jgi:archaellum component FlaG (FlaF/FlaG flagellin family)
MLTLSPSASFKAPRIFLRRFGSTPSRGGVGVSYLATVLVATLLTVALAAPVAYFGYGQVAWSVDSWGSALGERRGAAAERFVVERVVFAVARYSHTDVTVYVRNYGSVPVTVSKILVDHRETVNAVTSTGSANLTLNRLQAGWVRVTLSYAIDEGVAHSVTVISSRGCVASGFWKVV